IKLGKCAVEPGQIGSETGIRWKLLLQPNDLLASELELLARLLDLALLRQGKPNAAMGNRDITLPIHIMGIGPGQAVANGERLLKPLQRFGRVALREQEIAGQQIRDGYIVLPSSVARVGSGQALSNGPARLIGGKRLGGMTLRVLSAAQSVIGDSDIALPTGIARIGRGDALCDV